MKRIFFSAGEASGDLHGSCLIRAIKAADPSVECVGLGGHRMAAAGMRLRYDLASRGIMGFTEVAKSAGLIRQLFREAVMELERTRPDGLVAIDYPGFNLRLARQAKRLGIPVIYYISPQVWAWKRGRIRSLARLVEKMLVILPFEEALYRQAGVDCVYVGHPLLDYLAETALTGEFSGGLVIGLLPGSREQEIRRLLPTELAVARGIRDRHPDARFVTPCVDALRERQVRLLAGDFPLETAVGKTYEVLAAARFCLVASGTATLETALFGVPMIILYKVSALSYLIARMLVRVDHVGLVNLLAGRRIVPEFLQGAAVPDAILPAALDLIAETQERAAMCDGLRTVREALGGPGASKRAAEEVLAVVGQKCRG